MSVLNVGENDPTMHSQSLKIYMLQTEVFMMCTVCVDVCVSTLFFKAAGPEIVL